MVQKKVSHKLTFVVNNKRKEERTVLLNQFKRFPWTNDLFVVQYLSFIVRCLSARTTSLPH